MCGSARESPASGATRDRRFPRAARLTESPQFLRVFEQARRRGDRFFTVLATPNDVGMARLGMAVSRRQLPRAVDRSRIRRIIRESFRQHRQDLGAYDIVVLARSEAARVDNAQLFAALERHWRRLART